MNEPKVYLDPSTAGHLENFIGTEAKIRKIEEPRRCGIKTCRTKLSIYNRNDYCFACVEKLAHRDELDKE